MVRYDLTGTVSGDMEVAVLPQRARPTALTPGSEYTYGSSGMNPAYLSAASQVSITDLTKLALEFFAPKLDERFTWEDLFA